MDVERRVNTSSSQPFCDAAMHDYKNLDRIFGLEPDIFFNNILCAAGEADGAFPDRFVEKVIRFVDQSECLSLIGYLYLAGG